MPKVRPSNAKTAPTKSIQHSHGGLVAPLAVKLGEELIRRFYRHARVPGRVYHPKPRHGRTPAIKIVVTIHKGGVGKSTTVVNLAGLLAQQGNRVLLVDCDSQGDLSSVFLDDHEDLPFTVADIFAGSDILTADLVQPTPFENIAIIPADRRLERFELTHDFRTTERAFLLVDALREVEHHYDYILMDTATRPHLSGCAALAAANVALIPLEAARFSFRSVASLRRELVLGTDLKCINPSMEIRYFLTKRKRSKVHDTCREALVETLGRQTVLQTEIPDSATINTALHLRKPVNFHAAGSKPTEAYRALLQELSPFLHSQQANHAIHQAPACYQE